MGALGAPPFLCGSSVPLRVTSLQKRGELIKWVGKQEFVSYGLKPRCLVFWGGKHS